MTGANTLETGTSRVMQSAGNSVLFLEMSLQIVVSRKDLRAQTVGACKCWASSVNSVSMSLKIFGQSKP